MGKTGKIAILLCVPSLAFVTLLVRESFRPMSHLRPAGGRSCQLAEDLPHSESPLSHRPPSERSVAFHATWRSRLESPSPSTPEDFSLCALFEAVAQEGESDAAIEGLALVSRFPGNQVQDWLLDCLVRGERPEYRSAAIRALGECADATYGAAILDRTRPDERREAMLATANVARRTGDPVLAQLLDPALSGGSE